MTTKLTIRWDGTVPGLQQHALSLSSWLKPLGTLLKAVRRAASNLDASRPDDPERGGRGGRHTPAAAAIDLQIRAVREGCVLLDLEATQEAPGQPELLSDLPARALATVVRDIEGEAGGRKRSTLARRFLAQLPKGITSQDYTVEHAGVVLVTAKIHDSAVAATSTSLPHLERIQGFIAGVGFDPSTISFRTNRRQRLTRSASEAVVQQALELRDGPVEAMCVAGPSPRVVWVRAAGVAAIPGDDERSASLRTRWERTLAILAR